MRLKWQQSTLNEDDNVFCLEFCFVFDQTDS